MARRCNTHLSGVRGACGCQIRAGRRWRPSDPRGSADRRRGACGNHTRQQPQKRRARQAASSARLAILLLRFRAACSRLRHRRALWHTRHFALESRRADLPTHRLDLRGTVRRVRLRRPARGWSDARVLLVGFIVYAAAFSVPLVGHLGTVHPDYLSSLIANISVLALSAPLVLHYLIMEHVQRQRALELL